MSWEQEKLLTSLHMVIHMFHIRYTPHHYPSSTPLEASSHLMHCTCSYECVTAHLTLPMLFWADILRRFHWHCAKRISMEAEAKPVAAGLGQGLCSYTGLACGVWQQADCLAAMVAHPAHYLPRCVDHLAHHPVDHPADDLADDPEDDPADHPADDPAGDPVDDPADHPADDSADDPVDHPVDHPADMNLLHHNAPLPPPAHP